MGRLATNITIFCTALPAAAGATPEDSSPPTVAVVAPAPDAEVGTSLSLAATAADDRAVARVEFFVDGLLVGTDAEPPYEASWEATWSRGPVFVTARAVDSAGNAAISGSHEIRVENGGLREPIPWRSSWRFGKPASSEEWKGSSYADESWAEGSVEQGFRPEEGERILVSGAPLHLRRRFSIQGETTRARLHVLFEGAVALWVNGVPVLDRDADAEQVVVAELPPELLKPGENVIAASLQRQGRQAVFDLRLEALTPGTQKAGPEDPPSASAP